MKKGMAAYTIIAAVLVLVIIIVFAVQGNQIMAWMDLNFFEPILGNKLFGTKTVETVTIPGTLVREADCLTIRITEPGLLAQAIIDCWNDGTALKSHIFCCSNIYAPDVQTPFGTNSINEQLTKKGRSDLIGNYEVSSNVPTGTLGKYSSELAKTNLVQKGQAFTLCYDQIHTGPLWTGNKVRLTRSPREDCD